MTILTTLPTDTFVTAALAELLDDVTNLLTSAQAQKPCDKDEIGFWRRQLSALNKAESYWLQGVRPQIAGDTYLLASASRPGALVHRLTKQGGIVVCSCEAGQRSLLCWHHMLCNVVERAAEMEALATTREDVSGGPDTTPDAHQLLSQRLDATAQILAAMRTAQGRSSLSFDPPGDNPLGDQEGDQQPGRTPAELGRRLAEMRAFYLAA